MKSLVEKINEADLQDLQIASGNEIIDTLICAFCEEMNAWYQYVIVAPFITGTNMADVRDFYKEAAKDELEDHGYAILERLNILGAKDAINKILRPEDWKKFAEHPYIVPETLDDDDDKIIESLEQNIEAERGAIETYSKLVEITRDADPVTHELAKHILGDEQEHLQKLEDLLAEVIS